MSEKSTPLTDAAERRANRMNLTLGYLHLRDLARSLESITHLLAATLIKSRGHVATNTRSKPRTRREAMRQTKEAISAYGKLREEGGTK